ncbi:EVI2B protein, partial [Cercotrichas coryphoeus]|nr:EVI2B protein [Cercotrichas coryphoeus]
MASMQLLLVLFCGEIWSCLCAAAAAPQHTAMAESSTATSPRAKPLLNQLQATGPSSHQSDTALATTEPQPFPGQEEAGDGSWVAAVMLGSILIGMVLAVLTILLWKCCMRPALAESHWAGRSPFVDGDTPDLLMDSEQGTKRSSVLFMLPWRLKQGTNLQEELTVSENSPQHTTSSENGQAALGCSPAPAPASDPVPAPDPDSVSAPAPDSVSAPAPVPNPAPVPASVPAPAPAPASSAAASCPAPDTVPECCDLPPPPEWLREPPEQPSLDPHEHSALHLEAEEPLPPAPELLIHEIHETLPQPEQPL